MVSSRSSSGEFSYSQRERASSRGNSAPPFESFAPRKSWNAFESFARSVDMAFYPFGLLPERTTFHDFWATLVEMLGLVGEGGSFIRPSPLSWRRVARDPWSWPPSRSP